jgi:endonuclease YncB( thermonuclease family)
LLTVPEDPGDDTVRVPVLRVFDGDGFLTRIVVPGRGVQVEAAVRFGFIDAPELGQPGGYEARDFLAKLIDRRWLDLVILLKMDTGRIIDGHGRIVAVPYLRQQDLVSRNIELEMVLNGWAWVLDRYEPEPHYFAALEDAQRHRRGIWARSGNIHPWEFKKQTHQARRKQQPARPRQSDLLLDQRQACPNEGCQGHVVERSGRFGRFYGCSEFPRCRYSSSSSR